MQRLITKIEVATGVPRPYYERFQVLHYDVGQKYQSHHDHVPTQNENVCGARILTFYLYLSEVEAGGETAFPLLKPPLVVKPKKGSAILWSHVQPHDYLKRDDRIFLRWQ